MNIDFHDMGGGIIQDLPAEQIQRNQWSDGHNVRFVRAQASRMSGHREIFGTASASGTIGALSLGRARYLLSMDDDNGNPWWIYPDLDFIYATDGTTHYDITYSATASSSITATTGALAATADYGWNGGAFNGLAVLNSHAQTPRYWTPGAANKTRPLTNWPAGTTCRVLRPYKTFLIAIGVNEGAGFNDNIVRWPTAADVGSLPPSWDYSDPTQDAGRYEIDDGYGVLLDGQQLRNDFFIYAEHAIYRLSPIPGNDIFAIRRQFSDVGLLTRHCITTVKHSHVFFGDGDIYIHDGQSMRSLVTKRWKKWVFDQIGENWRRSYVAHNYAENEVWFCFPVGGDEYPTLALVWDYDDDTLTSRDLSPAAKGGSPFIAAGKLPSSGDDTFDTGPAYTFDQADAPESAFNASNVEINVRDLVMAQYGASSTASGSASLFFEIDSGYQLDEADFTAYVEKDCLPLEPNGKFSQYNEYQVTAIRPRVRSNNGGNLTVKIGFRDSVGDTLSGWDDSATFVMGTDDKVDVRATGVVCKVRFECSDATDMELNGFSVDVEKVGVRTR